MSLRCGLFDSTEIVQTVDGYPQGNKAETADFFAHALAGLSGDGVPYSPADAFKVSANGSMAVSVAPGYCYIKGYHAWDESAATVTISSSSAARTIYISMRLNLINGEITLINDTEFTRAQSIYDLALARLDIPANTAAITEAMVTDLRDNKNYCGRLQKITDSAAEEIWNHLLNNIQPVSLGGTGANSAKGAFSTIVSPGGTMAGDLKFMAQKGLCYQATDQKFHKMLWMDNQNNLIVGANDITAKVDGLWSGVTLQCNAKGDAYVRRGTTDCLIFDNRSAFFTMYSGGALTEGKTVNVTDDFHDDPSQFTFYRIEISGQTAIIQAQCTSTGIISGMGCGCNADGTNTYITFCRITLNNNGTATCNRAGYIKIVNSTGAISVTTGQTITKIVGIL